MVLIAARVGVKMKIIHRRGGGVVIGPSMLDDVKNFPRENPVTR